MRFNRHSELSGRHAFLSASKYHWIRYNHQQLEAKYHSHRGAVRGTDLHNHAHESIRLGIYLLGPTPEEVEDGRGNPPALVQYVKDGIDMRMVCEQPLFYSENCFGSADNISFNDGLLRIHDLKNGVTPTKFDQLKIYAALYCLEYSTDPMTIDIELRIYQREEVLRYIPEPEEIIEIMNTIVEFDAHIEAMKEG